MFYVHIFGVFLLRFNLTLTQSFFSSSPRPAAFYKFYYCRKYSALSNFCFSYYTRGPLFWVSPYLACARAACIAMLSSSSYITNIWLVIRSHFQPLSFSLRVQMTEIQGIASNMKFHKRCVSKLTYRWWCSVH